MPLSELLHATRSKMDSSQSRTPNFSSDLPSAKSDRDLVELLWENGQIVMQGQSGRPKKTLLSSIFPSHSSRIPEKEKEKEKDHLGFLNQGALRPTGSPGGEYAPYITAGSVGLNSQEDDMAPWLNYPMDDYYSELLSEFSSVTESCTLPGPAINPTPVDKGTAAGSSGLHQVARDMFNGELHGPRLSPMVPSIPDVGKVRTGMANQLAQQWPNGIQSSKDKASDLVGVCSSMASGQNSIWVSPIANKDSRQDVCLQRPPVLSTSTSTSTGVINFSHFSRPASLLRTNLQNTSRLRSERSPNIVGNRVESVPSNSSTCHTSTMQENLSLISCKTPVGHIPHPPRELSARTDVSEARNWRDGVRHDHASSSSNIVDKRLPDNSQIQSAGSLSFTTPLPDAKKGAENSVLTPSSVPSGSGCATESTDPLHKTKRKVAEEESDYQSEDIEGESIGAKKLPAARGSASKRSRAAEVHNLSERRRRDRINEKMRALQELIPNCNKADKASMLDEAIEYLKSLQLQVQIMSMGGGFCMPPVMLPPAMQRIRPPHMPHFPQVGVGVGMGMGVGYGMGMLNMSGSPSIPLPAVPNPHFPCSSTGVASGMNSMSATTTSGLPFFGIPSQGVPVTMQCGQPFLPLSAHSWSSAAAEVVGSDTGQGHGLMVDHEGSKDNRKQKVIAETSIKEVKSTNVCMEHSPLTPSNDQASNSEEPVNSCSGNANSSGASEQCDWSSLP